MLLPDDDMSMEEGKEAAPALRAGSSLRFALAMVAGCVVLTLIIGGLLRSGMPGRLVPASRFTAASVPPSATKSPRTSNTANLLTYPADRTGHYFVEASVNGATIRFLVDTGATVVSLSPEDARAAGVGGNLTYSLRMSTAHGEARAARASLREVRLGQLSIEDVTAVVMEEDMPISLLGMSFLNRLNSYSFKDGILTIER